MSFSIEFIFRIGGAIVGAIAGGYSGDLLAELLGGPQEAYVVVLGLVGILTGLILTPYLTIRPLRQINRRLTIMPAERLVAITLGIFLGLFAAALFSIPISLLPTPLREVIPIIAAVFFCYLSIFMLTSRQNDLKSIFSNFRPIVPTQGGAVAQEDEDNVILLDTSVIIDGRITDISKTGFIRSTLLVPNFVLSELQHIADSPDSLRRNRGRRGLEVLSILQNESPIPIRITDMDVSEVRDVDSKLVSLSRHLLCPIMTNDYNLNRVAELQGITVLNINDLANAVKVAYIPGEALSVTIIQEGKETDQGVAFLEDGTMVVVENGLQLMHNTLNVTVTKVLQTTAGRMIFARP